jgi:amino acid transporter
MSVESHPDHADLDDDARHLAELGYTQELHRGMSGFSNFAVSFSIISILAGCITSYGIALRSGGPSTLVLGWLIVGILVLAVAGAMAEVCSRYPTAGGLYFWAGRLAKKNKREWAWFTGWFNFLGEVAVTAAIDFGCATTWMAFMNLVWGVEATPARTFALFVAIIVVHGLLNTFGVNLVSLLSNVSAWWHVGGVLVIVAALWILPESHQSVSWTLTGFHNETGWTFLPYVFLMGLLMAQYTYTGYDASAHVAEETKNASVAAPRGIVTSVLVSVIGGFILLYSITASITDRSVAGLTRLSESETVLLRHGVGDGELPDVLRVLPRQGTPRLADLGQGQPAHRYADQLDLALRGAVGHPGLAGPDQLDGLLRGHLDRGDRPLHRLRGPRAAAPAQP